MRVVCVPVVVGGAWACVEGGGVHLSVGTRSVGGGGPESCGICGRGAGWGLGGCAVIAALGSGWGGVRRWLFLGSSSFAGSVLVGPVWRRLDPWVLGPRWGRRARHRLSAFAVLDRAFCFRRAARWPRTFGCVGECGGVRACLRGRGWRQWAGRYLLITGARCWFWSCTCFCSCFG